MAGVVLDASSALALLAPSQMTLAARAFATALPAGLTAPRVFGVEVRHALLRLERRGSLSIGAADAYLAQLEQELAIAPDPGPADLGRVMAIARDESLGMHDAFYLDLAMERGARLASRDAALLAAAERHAVEAIDLR